MTKQMDVGCHRVLRVGEPKQLLELCGPFLERQLLHCAAKNGDKDTKMHRASRGKVTLTSRRYQT